MAKKLKIMNTRRAFSIQLRGVCIFEGAILKLRSRGISFLSSSVASILLGRMWLVLSVSSSFGKGVDLDLGDHAQFSHAMEVETREVNGVATVFQYGEIRPDFESTVGNSWRHRFDLNGEWDFRFEGDEKSRSVVVPHNWEAMAGSKFWDQDDISHSNPARFDGAGWYSRKLSVEKKSKRRYRLEFGGVRERVRVWVNERLVAMHEGLGAPFSIDVTDALVAGENEVKLKVLRLANHRRGEDGKWEEIEGVHTPYPKAPDYWPYAGITGSVALWEEEEATIRKIQVRTRGDQLLVRAFIANAGSEPFVGELTLDSSVFEQSLVSQEVMLASGEVRVVEFERVLRPESIRWTPSTPQLYELEAQLITNEEASDGCSVTFGLREFGTSNTQLQLNGNAIFLKGMAAYSETEKGAAMSRLENEKILQRAKDAGANFVRLPVRQCDPMVYQLADEMGLMVTGEWGGFWYKEKSMKAQTEDQFSIYQSMGRVAVWDLMNRPSVILWCTSNECHQFGPEYALFTKMGRELVREIDEGLLPVTWAAWHPHEGQPHFEWADVVGFNEYRGAMDPFEDLEPDMEKVRQQNPGKPIVIMENGSWSRLGFRSSKKRRGSEDWQADLLRRQWDVLQNYRPQLCGYTFWILQDYRSRKTYTGNRRSNGWSKMGMYTSRGEAKLVRDLFRDMDFSQ